MASLVFKLIGVATVAFVLSVCFAQTTAAPATNQPVVAAADRSVQDVKTPEAKAEAEAEAEAEKVAVGPPAPRSNPNARASPIADYVTLLFSKINTYCSPIGYYTISSTFGTLDTCAQACLMRADCAFFSYYSNTQSCELKHAISGYAWVRYRYAHASCTTYYKRLSGQIAPTSVADGRSYYEYMGVSASHDNATSYCRNRGRHLADIRSVFERNAALSALPTGSFWMNLYPAYAASSGYFRYREDAVTLSNFVTSFAPSGLTSSPAVSTAYCGALANVNYWVAPDCVVAYAVVCQYSDLDRF